MKKVEAVRQEALEHLQILLATIQPELDNSLSALENKENTENKNEN